MKFILDNWMLIVVALSSGGMLLWPVIKGSSTAGLSAAQVVQLINREKAVLVDVSEAEEYAAGHAAGARSVPLGELEARLGEVAKNKAAPVVFVCATGGRAGRAIMTAKKLGYEQAVALGGGLKAWKESNLPVEKA